MEAQTSLTWKEAGPAVGEIAKAKEASIPLAKPEYKIYSLISEIEGNANGETKWVRKLSQGLGGTEEVE